MKIDKDTFNKIITYMSDIDSQVAQLDSMGLDFTHSILIRSWEDLTKQLFTLAFGNKATDAIYTFISNNIASPFSSMDELYDFVTDEYIEYVSEDALPLNVLMKKLEASPMIQSFHKFISEYNDSKSLNSEGK